MAVLIRAKRVEDKIRKLARQNGETLSRAVEKAVDSQLAAMIPAPKGRVDWASAHRNRASRTRMAGLGDRDRRERSSHDRHRQLGRGRHGDGRQTTSVRWRSSPR